MSLDNEDLRKRIEAALDSMRPYLQGDGGDVRLFAINEDMSVELELMGNCESCHMSKMNLGALQPCRLKSLDCGVGNSFCA